MGYPNELIDDGWKVFLLASAEGRVNIGNSRWDHDHGPVYEMNEVTSLWLDDVETRETQRKARVRF